MRRIDFLGAPGVGKSTIYRSLIDNRGNESKLLTLEEGKIKFAKAQLERHNLSRNEQLNKIILNFPLLKPFHKKLIKNIVYHAENRIIWDEKEKNSEFLNYALAGTSNIQKPAIRRLMGINWFFEIYKNIIMFDEFEDENFVLFDESLPQKIYGVTYSDNVIDKNQVSGYFMTMPLPACLVYCKLNHEEAFKRLKTRDKVIPGHRGIKNEDLLNRIKNQIEVSSTGAEILKDRGCDIIEIDMSLGLKQNTDYLEQEIIKLLY